MFFDVIDPDTGKYPNLESISLGEEWADDLCYCDILGFSISEDGCLSVQDSLGNTAFPPIGRFKIAAFNFDHLIYEKAAHKR